MNNEFYNLYYELSDKAKYFYKFSELKYYAEWCLEPKKAKKLIALAIKLIGDQKNGKSIY